MASARRKGHASVVGSVLCEPVAKKALGVDRIVAEPLAEALAKLTNVAFDHILIDPIVEKAVHEIENLRFSICSLKD